MASSFSVLRTALASKQSWPDAPRGLALDEKSTTASLIRLATNINNRCSHQQGLA